jgi:hypothetical protein
VVRASLPPVQTIRGLFRAMVTAEERDGRSLCPSVSVSLARHDGSARHVSPFRLARKSRRSASAVLNRSERPAL